MTTNLKIFLPSILVLFIGFIQAAVVINGFSVLNFELILGVICFPFVLSFTEKSNKISWRYFIWGGVFLILYILLGINSLAFFAAGFNVFFILENTIGKINPDVVFLSSEPFPFQENHVSNYQSLYPDAEIILVDGERCSWYGVRTLRC